MHSEALTICVIGVAVGMLTMSAFLAIVLWAAAALAGQVEQEQEEERREQL